MPAIGWKEPGPAQHLAGFDSFDSHWLVLRRDGLQGDFALADQIKVGRVLPFVKKIVPGIKTDIHRTSSNEFHRPRIESLKERMRGQNGFECVHHASPFSVLVTCSLARSARTSSVRSMPTGHQVMQRPQPTHPDVPN